MFNVFVRLTNFDTSLRGQGLPSCYFSCVNERNPYSHADCNNYSNNYTYHNPHTHLNPNRNSQPYPDSNVNL